MHLWGRFWRAKPLVGLGRQQPVTHPLHLAPRHHEPVRSWDQRYLNFHALRIVRFLQRQPIFRAKRVYNKTKGKTTPNPRISQVWVNRVNKIETIECAEHTSFGLTLNSWFRSRHLQERDLLSPNQPTVWLYFHYHLPYLYIILKIITTFQNNN